jgi:hypothetical protein
VRVVRLASSQSLPERQELIATWCADSKSPLNRPLVSPRGRSAEVCVEVRWRLDRDSEELLCSAGARVVSLPAAGESWSFRIWRLDFPVFDIPEFENPEGDRLLSGIYGGWVYSSPTRLGAKGLHLSNSLTELFRTPQGEIIEHPPDDLDPETTGTDIINFVADPGGYSIPLVAYYSFTDPARPLVYFAVEDQEGRVKRISIDARPSASGTSPDRMRLRLSNQNHAPDLLSPAPNGVDEYSIPYPVRVGLLRGDWIDAARRFRDEFRNYRGYPGPAASARNTIVGPTLKNSYMIIGQSCPVQTVLGVTDMAYQKPCYPEGAPEALKQTRSSLAVIRRYFEDGCALPLQPLYDLNRFPVNAWCDFVGWPEFRYERCRGCHPSPTALPRACDGLEDLLDVLPRGRILMRGLSEVLGRLWRASDSAYAAVPCSPKNAATSGHEYPNGVYPHWLQGVAPRNKQVLRPGPIGEFSVPDVLPPVSG